MTASSPAAAQPAAIAAPRFPVEAQKSVSIPKPWAAATALAAIRSLKECVGFAVSSFRWTSMSSAAEIRGAGTSGVRLGSAVSRCGSNAP